VHRNTLPRLHPLTGAPIVPLGRRRDGRLIWPIMGGSEPAGEPAPAPAPAPEPSPAPAPTPAPSPSPAPAAEWDGKVESLPEPVQKMIRDLRNESAERRTKLTAAEQAQQDAIRALAKAAGIELPGEQAPDPQQLTQQLTATQQQARQAAVELAVYKAAGAHQGDPLALLDSRAFLAKVADLDPTAEDFTTKVSDAIKGAVTDNPKLRSAPVAGASSADHAGGSGEQRVRTPKPMAEAVASTLGF